MKLYNTVLIDNNFIIGLYVQRSVYMLRFPQQPIAMYTCNLETFNKTNYLY